MTVAGSRQTAQVIDFFTGRTLDVGHDNNIVRVSPECDGLGMLYSNDSNPGKLFSMKIMGWGLRADGEVIGLAPWLNSVMPCTELTDPLNGRWEGYYNSNTGDIFYEPPQFKQIELSAAHAYYLDHLDNQDSQDITGETVAQEIPDTIGTHAVIADLEQHRFKITEVFSWRLFSDGAIKGLIIDKTKIKKTPVLVGDSCLVPIQDNPDFRYFFQYRIANKIKAEDPEALEAMALLMDF